MNRRAFLLRTAVMVLFAVLAILLAHSAATHWGNYRGDGGSSAASEEREGAGKTEGTGKGSSEGTGNETSGDAGERGGSLPEEDNLERGHDLTERYRNFSGTVRREVSRRRGQEKPVGPGYPGSESLPAPTDPSAVWIASDLHYCSPTMTDYGEAFRERLDEDDGKDEEDIDSIVDTWINEILKARPSTVVLSGDLAFDGETENHRVLAEKLRKLKEDGIQPLVIPGNHDIGCDFWASSYHGDVKESAPTPMHAEEFRELYHEFGYDQASSSDASSLSYCYHVDEKHWFLMLDSAIYEPENKVAGRIRKETLTWMEEVLQSAEDAGAQVIPVAHHNLLSESRLYRTDCTLENNEEVISLLEKYRVPLFVSGHLHLQRIRPYRPEPGVEAESLLWEIVSGCFAMTPFPYGVLRFGEDGALSYQMQTVGVSAEVHQNGLDEFRRVISRKTEQEIRGIPEYVRLNMADTYASLLENYVAGRVVDEKEYRASLGYRMMEHFIPGSEILQKVEWMLKDTKQDQSALEITAGVGEKDASGLYSQQRR